MVFVNTILKCNYFKSYCSNLKPSVCNNLHKTCLFSCSSLFEGYVCYASVQILLTSLAGQVSLITAGVFEYFLRYLSFPVIVGIRLLVGFKKYFLKIYVVVKLYFTRGNQYTHTHLQSHIKVDHTYRQVSHAYINIYIYSTHSRTYIQIYLYTIHTTTLIHT